MAVLKASRIVLNCDGVIDALSDFGIKLTNQRWDEKEGLYKFDIPNIEGDEIKIYFQRNEKDNLLKVADYEIL